MDASLSYIGKKKKGKPKSQSKKATISLTEFLADVPSNSPTAPPYRTKSWADESAELNEDGMNYIILYHQASLF